MNRPLADLTSFVPIASDNHFPIQNLPFGIGKRRGRQPACCVALGDYAVDLAALVDRGLLNPPAKRNIELFATDSLNPFMALGPAAWRDVRHQLLNLFAADNSALRDDAAAREVAFVPMPDVDMLLPAKIGDYTDFYSSKDHAYNVGCMMRGHENALQPNWVHLPVGYHGRAGSVVVSGTDLKRPWGQTKADNAPLPKFGPSRTIDFELEMGFFIGPPTALGHSIPIANANEHIFGMVLVNDWSARDIQKWEYVPLGPFLAKNFGTTISPWIVTLDALEPFRGAGPAQDPPVLEHLRTSQPWQFDIELEVWLKPETASKPTRVCRSNAKHLYWNVAQQLAHHTSNGCNVRTGDLMASGTISGPTEESRGCLLERTWRGEQPVELIEGGMRRFIEDGDSIIMTGWAQGAGYRVGFGEARGKLLANPGT